MIRQKFMSQDTGISRHTVAAATLICYLVPIFFLSAYSLMESWFLFSMGLACGGMGSGSLFLLLCRWELAWRREAQGLALTTSDPSRLSSMQQEFISSEQGYREECQKQYSQLLAETELQNRSIQVLQDEKEALQRQMQSIMQELTSYKTAVHEQMQQKDAMIKGCHDRLMEQQSLLESKQKQIQSLESKERDLIYEIKTLLKLVPVDTLVL